MIITLDNNVRKLRVWLGELPDASYSEHDVVEFIHPASNLAITKSQQVAIEYYRYTELILEGLVGATFDPDSSGLLHVRMAQSAGLGATVDWSLNPFYGGATGLSSRETIEYIVRDLRNWPFIEQLGSGKLYFACAIEGTPAVMSWLAKAVVILLSQGTDVMDEESIQLLMAQNGPPFLWFVNGLSPANNG